jgi:hypothetical protein
MFCKFLVKNWLACGLYNLWKSPKIAVSRTVTIIMADSSGYKMYTYILAML